MNKQLWEKEFKSGIQTLKFTEESLELILEDGARLSFETHHTQDCCESVYGDFSIAKYHETELRGKHLQKVVVKGVEEMGFLLCFDFGYQQSKIFIPCYNYQNGYYSSQLDLLVKEGEVTTRMNINDFVEDHID